MIRFEITEVVDRFESRKSGCRARSVNTSTGTLSKSSVIERQDRSFTG